MRFTDPTNGQFRTVSRFLWLPKTLQAKPGGPRQTRWLERATWRQWFYYPLWYDAGYWEDDK